MSKMQGNNEQEFLFEGQVERLNTCKVQSKNPLIIVEKHFDDRLKVDRNYVDAAKIKELNSDMIRDIVMNMVHNSYNDAMTKWETKCKSLADAMENPPKNSEGLITKPLPFLKGYKYILYHVIPIKVTGKEEEYAICVACEVLCDTLYTSKFRDDAERIWREEGLEGLNNFFKSKAPSKFKSFIEDKKMAFNKPYLFVGTVIPFLVSKENISNKLFKGDKIDERCKLVYGDTITMSNIHWEFMLDKALKLPAMRGNVILNKKSNSIVQEFYNQGYFDDRLQ